MSDTNFDDIDLGDRYDKTVVGILGELGSAENVRVRFVQTALTPKQLDGIDLVSEIPGSEKWSIRDLFQRDVDESRVSGKIMPYLRDGDAVKFFNPLTLVVLPIRVGAEIHQELPYLDEPQDGRIEYDDYYKLELKKPEAGIAVLSWNSEQCRVVAIDGQHRLSALKRLKSEPNPSVEIGSWRIPAVVLFLSRDSESQSTRTALDIVRRTFVYINSTAVAVSETRRILLDDEDITSVCTQELVEKLHSNDTSDNPDKSLLPLFAVNWRDDTTALTSQNVVSLKSAKELHEWMKRYFLQSSSTDGVAANRLPLSDHGIDPSKNKLAPNEAQVVRKVFKETMQPGLVHFLSHFGPYAEFTRRVRQFESQENSDASKHAFNRIRFGSALYPKHIEEAVRAKEKTARDAIRTAYEDSVPKLLRLEVGMRGVAYAFGELYDLAVDINLSRGDERPSWEEYAKSISPIFSEIANEGWFDSFDHLKVKHRNLLKYVVYDHQGTDGIRNYRPEDISKGLGALVLLMAISKATTQLPTFKDLSPTDESLSTAKEQVMTDLMSSVLKMTKKLKREEIRPTWSSGTIKQMNERITKEAEKEAQNYKRELTRTLNAIEAS